MNFKPELAAKVMAGEKTVTRRLVSDNPRSPWYWNNCGLRPGLSYAVCPGRGKHQIGRVRVLSTRRQVLGYVSHDEAQAEGFGNASEFVDVFAAINGNYDPNMIVWRVEFKVDADA